MPWCPQCGVEYRDGFEQCSDCEVPLSATPPEPRSDHGEWVPVGAFDSREEATLARGLLLGLGIEAEVVDKHVVLMPFPDVDQAEVYVVVPPSEVARAEQALDAADAGADRIGDGEADLDPTEGSEPR